jgi:hypothetical protein
MPVEHNAPATNLPSETPEKVEHKDELDELLKRLEAKYAKPNQGKEPNT